MLYPHLEFLNLLHYVTILIIHILLWCFDLSNNYLSDLYCCPSHLVQPRISDLLFAFIRPWGLILPANAVVPSTSPPLTLCCLVLFISSLFQRFVVSSSFCQLVPVYRFIFLGWWSFPILGPVVRPTVHVCLNTFGRHSLKCVIFPLSLPSSLHYQYYHHRLQWRTRRRWCHFLVPLVRWTVYFLFASVSFVLCLFFPVLVHFIKFHSFIDLPF